MLVRLPCGPENGSRLDQKTGWATWERVSEVSVFLRNVDRAWCADGSVYVLLCPSATGLDLKILWLTVAVVFRGSGA